MKTFAYKIWLLLEFIGEFILLLLGIQSNLTIQDPLLLSDVTNQLCPYIIINSICISDKISISMSCLEGLCLIINITDIEVICNLQSNNSNSNNNDDIENNNTTTNNNNDNNNNVNNNQTNQKSGWLVNLFNYLQISIIAKVANLQVSFQIEEDSNHLDNNNNNNNNNSNNNNNNSNSNINLMVTLKDISFKSKISSNMNLSFASLIIDLESKYNKKDILIIRTLEVDYIISTLPSGNQSLITDKNKMNISLKEINLLVDMDPYNHYYFMKILTLFSNNNRTYDNIDDMYISRREQFFSLLDDIENDSPWRYNDSYDDEEDGSNYFLASDGILNDNNRNRNEEELINDPPIIIFELVCVEIFKISIVVSTSGNNNNNIEILSINEIEASYENSNESIESNEKFHLRLKNVRGSTNIMSENEELQSASLMDLNLNFNNTSRDKRGSIVGNLNPIFIELDITALTALTGFASNIMSIFQSADVISKSSLRKHNSNVTNVQLLWENIELEISPLRIILVDEITSSMIGIAINEIKIESTANIQKVNISSVTIHVFNKDEIMVNTFNENTNCIGIYGLQISIPQNDINTFTCVDKLLNVDRLSSSDWSNWIDTLDSSIHPLEISISKVTGSIGTKEVQIIGKIAGSLTSFISILFINSSKYTYMIPYSVFYIYESHKSFTTVLTIGDIDVCISCTSYQIPQHEVKYKLSTGNVSIKSKSIGTIASKTDIFLKNNIVFDYIDEMNEKSLNILKIDVTGCSNSLIPTIAQIRCPVENMISSDNIGIGYHASYSSIKLREVSLTFEAKVLQPLFSLLSLYSNTKDDSYRRQIQIFPHLSMHISQQESFETSMIGNAVLKRTLKKPNEVTFLNVDQTSIIFMHEFKHVLILGKKNLETGILQFGPGLNQICGSFNSITMVDMMLDSAIHRNYLYDIDSQKPSLIRFHMSSYYGQKPLIELDGERLKIQYLQRTTMTLINYFADHLIAEIYKAWDSQSTKPKAKKWKQPENIGQIIVNDIFGMLRLSIAIRYCQGELPISSNATDSMAIIGKRGEIFLFVEELPEGFCKGPLLDKGIWMSEMDNVKIATAGLRNDSTNVDFRKVSWKLYQYAEQELVAPEISISPTQPFTIKFFVFDVIFSSWCTESILGHNKRIDVIIKVEGGDPPEFDGLYSGAMNSLGYKLDSTKVLNDTTKLQVDIIAEEAAFTITQGHYTTLIYSIFENFCELNALVPPTWILPVPKKVEVTHELWENGRECMDTRLPILSSVTVKVKSGLVTAYENSQQYYDLVQRNLKIPCPFEERDSTPSWGCHHIHRDKHYRSMPSMPPGSHPDIYEFDPELYEVEMGTPLMSILVDEFFIDFFRRHHGGGFGMEANAESLTLLREDANNSLHATTLDFEDENKKVNLYDPRYGHISPESIILVSKAQLDAWGVGITSDKINSKKNEKKEKMISYRQRGVGNLRQCFIDINDSVLVGHGDKILLACRFFGIPLSLTYARSVAFMQLRTDMQWDMNWFIDFIVNIKDTVLCFPEFSNNQLKTLCFNGDAKYTHAWRGFLDAGPGSATCSVTYDLSSLFIAQLFSEEISLSDVESLVTPFLFDLKMEYISLSGKLNYIENNIELSKLMIFPPHILLPGIHDVKPTCSRIWNVSAISKNSESKIISFNFSLQDIKFINAISSFQKELFKPVPIQPPVLSELYPIGFQSFRDIMHLPLLVYYHPHVPKREKKTFDGFYEYVDKHCVYFNMEHTQLVLHNNTYNLQITKTELLNIVYAYENTNEKLHIEGTGETLIWTHNEENDAWEPFLEKTKAIVITATEKSGNENDKVSLITLQLKFDPIEVSLSQRTIRNFLYVMSLADVVTSSSSRLLPYTIVNELGTDVDCMLSIDSQEPVVAQLLANTSISLKKSEIRPNQLKSTSKESRGKKEKNEHSLAIMFKWNDQLYESIDYISIDKAGSFPLNVVQKKKEQENLAQKIVSDIKSVISNQDDVTPSIILNIRINNDGAREISLRSVLSFTNNINRPIFLLIKYLNESIENCLNEGCEWSVPIKFAHPKATTLCRLSKDENWFTALSSLSACVQQGSFGTKLRAEICSLPSDWSLLFKPEISEMTSTNFLLSVVGVNLDPTNVVALKFPASTDRKIGATSPTNFDQSRMSDKGSVKLNDIYNSFFKSKTVLSQMMKIHLLPPLQLLSLIPQPLFYRLAYSNGKIIAEGVLLIGEIINIHSFLFFESNIYISLRMINYGWSKWFNLMERQNPYNHSERESDLTISLPSMDFFDNYCMPAIEFSLLFQDQLLKISCPILLCNSTGLPLDFCEASSPQNFIRLMSSHAIENIMSKNNKNSKNSTKRSSEIKRSSFSGMQGTSSFVNVHDLKESINPDIDYSNAITIIIHMPFDHLNKCEVLANPDWTLAEVFEQVSVNLAVNSNHRKIDSYAFVTLENGKISTTHIKDPPANDDSIFSRRKSASPVAFSPEKGDYGLDGDNKDNVGDESLNFLSKNIFSRISNVNSMSNNDDSISSDDDGIPANMKLNMVATRDDVLPMSTVVFELVSNDLLLCHESELQLCKQVDGIKVIQNSTKNTDMMSMFNRKKASYKTDRISAEGLIPFNPKKLLFSSLMCIRADNTWSESIDLLKAGLGGAGEQISLVETNSTTDISDSPIKSYDFGVLIERGKLAFDNISIVTIVPRYIISSKLSYIIQLRRAIYDNDMIGNNYEVFELLPGNALTIHFSAIPHKLLEICEIYEMISRLDSTSSDDQHEGKKWYGEIDITALGIGYVKLPNKTIKIEVEFVGASLVATFMEEQDNNRWPPYRLENHTSLNIRFCQQDSKENQSSNDINKSTKSNRNRNRSGSESTKVGVSPNRDTTISSHIFSNLINPLYVDNEFSSLTGWGLLPSRNVQCFYWDRPNTAEKSLRVEFAQGGQWEGVDMSLDEINLQKNIELHRALPELNNPIYDGYLMRKEVGQDIWVPIYCVLQAGIFYMFRTHEMDNFLGSINLLRQSGNELKTAAIYKMQQLVWNTTEHVNATVTLSLFRSNKSNNNDRRHHHYSIDLNTARIIILKIASTLGAFDDLIANATNSDYNKDDKKKNTKEKAKKITIKSLSVVPDLTVKALLKSGYTVNMLLDICSKKTFNDVQVIDALIRLTDGNEKACRKLADKLLADGLLIYYTKNQHDSNSSGSPKADTPTNASKLKSALLRQFSLSPRNKVNNTTYSFTNNQFDFLSSSSTSSYDDNNNDQVNCFKLCLPSFIDEKRNKNSSSSSSSSSTNDNLMTEFSIHLEETNYLFKSISSEENNIWVQKCYESVESIWMQFCKGESSEQLDEKKDVFKIKVVLKIRPDGPTKVLEIKEDEGYRESRGIVNSFFSSKSSEKREEGSLKTSKKDLLLQTLSNGDSKEISTDVTGTKKSLSLFISLNSFSISIIDAEPAEVFYILFSEIDVSMERSKSDIKFAATVQEVQVTCQLLRPVFPVTLSPRRTNSSNRLLLPGLHRRGDRIPTMHVYFQIKADGDDVIATNSSSKMIYFEMATLWLAPLQIDIDEEAIIRFIRYSNEIKTNFNRYKELIKKNSGQIYDPQLPELESCNSLKTPNAKALVDIYKNFKLSGRRIYAHYEPGAQSRNVVYFGLLQLHPVDIIFTARASPSFPLSTTEMAITSLILQLSNAHFRLNALIAENAYGSRTMIREIVTKHYRGCIWRQLHKFLGGGDFVDGSVGLMKNLGVGVHDLFYEPIDGVLDDDKTFIDGLSKGGSSLASSTIRSIGGTTSISGNIAGGIGQGVSILTMDSEFYRKSVNRRVNKIESVGEGVYSGSKDIGKNIVEGVSGIFESPLRGWESGGTLGFGMGFAQGILGVALKPAVGVFDFASKTAEGFRQTAIGDKVRGSDTIDSIHAQRTRIPRAFGRNGLVLSYDVKKAAIQYIADKVTNPRVNERDSRFQVLYHLTMTRSLYPKQLSHLSSISTDSTNFEPVSKLDQGYLDFSSITERWGMEINNSYLIMIGNNRIILAEIKSSNKAQSLNVDMIWSCPTECIDEIDVDSRGDLVLTTSTSVSNKGAWNRHIPTIQSKDIQDYYVFQAFLEQTTGVKVARKQTLYPTGGFIQRNVLKTYTSGLQSILMSSTEHTYQIYGYCLYEYSKEPLSLSGALNPKSLSDVTENLAKTARSSFTTTSNLTNNIIQNDVKELTEPENEIHSFDNVHDIIEKRVCELYGKVTSNTINNEEQYGVLSAIYPLIDITISGPFKEDNDRYYLTISNKGNKPMRYIFREDGEKNEFVEGNKTSLKLSFSSQKSAIESRQQLETHNLPTPNDIILTSSVLPKKKRNMSIALRNLSGLGSVSSSIVPEENSIAGILVIPSCGLDINGLANLKMQIGLSLSSS